MFRKQQAVLTLLWRNKHVFLHVTSQGCRNPQMVRAHWHAFGSSRRWCAEYMCWWDSQFTKNVDVDLDVDAPNIYGVCLPTLCDMIYGVCLPPLCDILKSLDLMYFAFLKKRMVIMQKCHDFAPELMQRVHSHYAWTRTAPNLGCHSFDRLQLPTSAPDLLVCSPR
jgi:hypothetical protein